jgi:hypothetical protein
MELWPVTCSKIALYYNSPKNSIYLAVSHQPRLRPQPAHSILLSLLLMQPLNADPAIYGAKLMELWLVRCCIIALYYNSPKNSIYLAVSWEPRLRPQPTHSILLSPLLLEPLNPAPALFGAKRMELWPVTCSIIALYYNSPNNSRYLAISREPRLRPDLAHSIWLSLLLMEPLNPAPALFGAKLMELWPVRCCVIALYYNLPKNSMYLAISHQPRLRPQPAHSILLSLLRMQPLNPDPAIYGAKLMELWPVTFSIIALYISRRFSSTKTKASAGTFYIVVSASDAAIEPSSAIYGAKLMELWPVTCSSIALYYNSPNNSRYLAVSWEPRLRSHLAHSILLSLLLMEPLNPAPALFGAKLMELWPVTCSIIALYYNSPNNSRYLSISREPRLRPHLAHSILLSLLLMEPLNPVQLCLGLNSWSYGRLDVALSLFTTTRPRIVYISPFLINQD